MNQKPTYEVLEQKIKALENESALRKETQKDLLVSEKKWNSFFKGAPIPIYVWKKEGEDFILTDVNDAAMTITNQKIGTFIGHKASELYADMPEISSTIEACFTTKKTVRREMTYRFSDKEKEQFIAITCGFFPPDFVVIHTEDITDRKHAEQELKNTLDHLESQVKDQTRDLEKINRSLRSEIQAREIAQKKSRENEERYRSFVDSSRSAIFIIQGDHFKYFNDTLCKISGYTDQELLTLPFWTIVHPDMREIVVERAKKRLMGLDPVGHYEIMLITKEGKTLYFDFSAAVHEFEDKPAIFGTAFEITESKLAKENLRESEEKYRTIIENIEEAYFEVDLSGNLIFFNDALCRIIGRPREELMGANYREYTSPEMGEKMFRVFNQVFNTGSPAIITHYEIITPQSKETIYVELSTSLIRDKAGLPKGFRGIVRDNTEKLMAERSKKELEHQLQQALRIEAIGTLAGGIAHDFNNLLTGIQGNLSILKIRKKPDDPEYKKILLIEDLVQSGAELTRQLLGFAMGGKYEVKPCAVNEIIEKSLKMIDRTKKAITIEKNIQKDLWRVEADRGQIEQVLLNIFVNAAHAMPHGGMLSLTTENVVLLAKEALLMDLPVGNYVKISVTDNGIGMDEKTAERVFEPFFTTKEMGRGTGLGLASAYGIIKNHFGSISLKSKKGEGTTFFIYLPASVKTESTEVLPEIEVEKGRETILFVDDEKSIRDIGVELLSEIGYKVVPAESGLKAVEYFKKNHSEIDLVILDMIMPGMNGKETFVELKKIRKDINVLLSSGYSMDEQTAWILEKGGDGFIQKPFSLKEISQKIRSVLEP